MAVFAARRQDVLRVATVITSCQTPVNVAMATSHSLSDRTAPTNRQVRTVNS